MSSKFSDEDRATTGTQRGLQQDAGKMGAPEQAGSKESYVPVWRSPSEDGLSNAERVFLFAAEADRRLSKYLVVLSRSRDKYKAMLSELNAIEQTGERTPAQQSRREVIIEYIFRGGYPAQSSVVSAHIDWVRAVNEMYRELDKPSREELEKYRHNVEKLIELTLHGLESTSEIKGPWFLKFAFGVFEGWANSEIAKMLVNSIMPMPKPL